MSDQKNNEAIEIADTKLGFIQKNGAKGLAVVILVTLLPYGGSLLTDYFDNSTEKSVAIAISPLQNDVNLLKITIKSMETMMINCKGGSKVLTATDIDYIARMAVKSQSVNKVKEMKRVLMEYPRDTEFQKIRLRKKLREILIRNSKVYVNRLNNYQHRALGKIGNYIWNTFPTSKFLDSIYELTVDSHADNEVIVMTDDVMTYMMDIQATFFSEMLVKMQNAECNKWELH